MANTEKTTNLLFLLLATIFAIQLSQGVLGSRVQLALSYPHKLQLKDIEERRILGSPKGLMIGSVAPTCTFNECRSCKYKCRAEQVPVEGNDPMNSAYHYKCVCHRLNNPQSLAVSSSIHPSSPPGALLI